MGSLLLSILSIGFGIFDLLILARVLMSWFPVDQYHPVVRTIHKLTEPILAPVRRVIPSTGGIDWSPMVVLIGAFILQQILAQFIYGMF